MKENDLEILSKICDENISEFETHRILKEMHSAPELRATYFRYNLIGHAIRKQLPKKINHNFTDEVMMKISEEEKNILKSNQQFSTLSKSNKIKTTIGLAIAASVAIFSFTTIQNFMQPETGVRDSAFVVDSAVEESDIQRASKQELQNFISNPKANSDFNSYMVNHAEYASPRVTMPHVRVVGYDKVQNNN